MTLYVEQRDKQEVEGGGSIDPGMPPAQGAHRQLESSDSDVAKATWALTIVLGLAGGLALDGEAEVG